MHIFASVGWHPPTNLLKTRGPHEFAVQIRREYDKSDVLNSQCLLLDAPTWKGGEFTPGGLLELLIDDRHKKRNIAGVGRAGIVVSDHLRQTLERTGLCHLVFRETLLTDDFDPAKRFSYTWTELEESPWWQFTSDLILPKLSPACTLVDRYGNPFKEGEDKGCWLQEGLHCPAEMHYRRRDLEQVSEFDVALTAERFGMHPNNWYPYTVVSQRAYQLISEQDPKAQFVPVRIDEG